MHDVDEATVLFSKESPGFGRADHSAAAGVARAYLGDGYMVGAVTGCTRLIFTLTLARARTHAHAPARTRARTRTRPCPHVP